MPGQPAPTVHPEATPATRGGGWVAVQVALGVAVVLVARRGPRPTAAHPGRRVAALALGAFGGAVGLLAARSLGPALTVFPRPRAGAPLAAGGPYRVVRHPMYTSAVALACAIATAGSRRAFIPTALLAVVLDRKAAREEAWLVRERPAYADYRVAVRWRFVPGIR